MEVKQRKSLSLVPVKTIVRSTNESNVLFKKTKIMKINPCLFFCVLFVWVWTNKYVCSCTMNRETHERHTFVFTTGFLALTYRPLLLAKCLAKYFPDDDTLTTQITLPQSV